MTTTTPIELQRDSALDDDFALDRALRIVRIFYKVYGGNPTTKRYLNELIDILVAVKQRARERHQEIERQRLEALYKEEQIAQLL